MRNRRIEKATKKTVGLFNKKNDLREAAKISLEFELYDSLKKEIKKLDKVDRKYEKAYAKLEKMEKKHNCKRIGITEGMKA